MLRITAVCRRYSVLDVTPIVLRITVVCTRDSVLDVTPTDVSDTGCEMYGAKVGAQFVVSVESPGA